MEKRQYYAKKITVRLTQEDVDFAESFAKEHQVSFKSAIRLLIELSQYNLDLLKARANVSIIRGIKIPYVNKLMLWVSQDSSDLIDNLARKNDVPKQEASRFLIRLAEFNIDILKERTNFFIVK